MVLPPPQHPYYNLVNHGEFEGHYASAEVFTGTKPSVWRRDRFYNLFEAVSLVSKLPGAVIECGVWRGLSLLLLCKSLERYQSNFLGEMLFAVDSFEGLSEPSSSDGIFVKGKKGDFSESIENVRARLVSYPNITFLKGWIPDILQKLDNQKYRLVHLDLDLVEPTLGALDYFLPKMVTGGIIICDDYGSVAWPETKIALDSYCVKNNLRTLKLSTCQLFIFV